MSFHVFGDESSNAEIVAYALVAVPVSKITDVDSEIRKAKLSFRGLEDAPIHCKDLLHGDPRALTPWSHLTADESFDLLKDVMKRTRQAGARAWIGYLDRRAAPDNMIFEGTRSNLKQEVSDLHLLLFAYWAAMAPMQDIVSPQQMRAWMDPNKDRLKLLDQNRKQFRLLQGFFPPNHRNKRFEPLQVGEAKPRALELADIVAHCGARALSSSQNKARHEAVLEQCRPGLSTVIFNTGSGPIISVKANTAAIAEIKSDFAALIR